MGDMTSFADHSPERLERFTQYLLGSLGDEDRDRLEAHLFECDRCFAELDAMRAVQGELARNRQAILAEPAEGSWTRYSGLAAAAVLVVAVGGWWIRQRPAPTQTAVVQPEQPAAPADRLPEAVMARLAEIEPPQFVPLAVRGDDPSVTDFDAGMRDYARGDYKTAIPRLERAAARDPRDPAALFFLAVCGFLTDDFAAAAQRFSAVVSLDGSQYQEPARFNLAKTLIRLDRLDDAEQQLQRTMQLGGSHAAEAQTLLDQLRAARGGSR
jgi:Tetratricopeptide repeat/Putative zinc-finger